MLVQSLTTDLIAACVCHGHGAPLAFSPPGLPTSAHRTGLHFSPLGYPSTARDFPAWPVRVLIPVELGLPLCPAHAWARLLAGSAVIHSLCQLPDPSVSMRGTPLCYSSGCQTGPGCGPGPGTRWKMCTLNISYWHWWEWAIPQHIFSTFLNNKCQPKGKARHISH